jgi:hypothetical protein
MILKCVTSMEALMMINEQDDIDESGFEGWDCVLERGYDAMEGHVTDSGSSAWSMGINGS